MDQQVQLVLLAEQEVLDQEEREVHQVLLESRDLKVKKEDKVQLVLGVIEE